MSKNTDLGNLVNGLFVDSTGKVGVGTTTPQRILDVIGSTNDVPVVSFGRGIAIGNWTGIHFGYSESGNSDYRKSALVFERTGTAGQGKIHILNNNGADTGSAALADARLTITSAGNVGIGTTAPANILDVQSSSGVGSSTASGLVRFISAGTTPVISVGQANSGRRLDIFTQSIIVTGEQFNIATGGANPLIFETNSTERMRISSGGDVGIGSISPDTYGFGSSGKYLTLQSVSGGFSLIQVISDSTSGAGIVFGSTTLRRASIEGTNGSNLVFSTNASNSGTSNTERMRITSGGQIGFNTSSPSRDYVFSNPNNRGAGGFEIICSDNIVRFLTYNRSTGVYFPLSLSEGTSNVLIGTNTDNGNRLNVSGSIYSSSSITSIGGMYPSGGIVTDNGIVINYGYAYGLNSNNQVSGNGWYMQVSTSWSNNFRFLYGGTGVGQGSAKFQIDTGGGYTGISDINKKKDIALSTLGLAEVMQLKPSTFKFKDDDNQEEQIGFIAQEVKDIIPYAYYEDKEGDDKFIGLKQAAFIPVLVKAIQELKAEIETLKNK
jgi:hypothetical protein